VRPIETMRLEGERRMRRGERFADVEDAIDASGLHDEEKATLWLLGWSYVHPRAQRREALAHLEHVIPAAPDAPSDRPRHLRIAGGRKDGGQRVQREAREALARGGELVAVAQRPRHHGGGLRAGLPRARIGTGLAVRGEEVRSGGERAVDAWVPRTGVLNRRSGRPEGTSR
jgi:hypothetical protein